MKCINCQEEWTLTSVNNLKENYCPFCGKEILRIDRESIVDVPSFLRYIIYIDGDKSFKDSQKIISLFSDFLPNLIVEKRILKVILESDVYEKIYVNNDSISKHEISKYISYLEDDFGLSSKWAGIAIDWIIKALNLDLEQLINKNNYSVDSCNQPNTIDNEKQKPSNKYFNCSEEFFNIEMFSFPDISLMAKDKSWVLMKDGTLIIGKENCKDDFSYKSSFRNNIKSIILSKNIEKTCTREFFGLENLVEVILPPTLTEIGFQSFSECKKLKNVYIQSELKTIKGKAFEDCNSLTGINIPDFIKYIGDDAFRGCNINVTVPKSCALCSGNEGITQ